VSGTKDNAVSELPVGKHDAERVLRLLLKQAQKGEITTVVVICSSIIDGDDDEDEEVIGAVWSDMSRRDVLWYARWFMSWLTHRYFGQYHEPMD